MRLRLEKFSYQFTKQIFNNSLNLKQEIKTIINGPTMYSSILSKTMIF